MADPRSQQRWRRKNRFVKRQLNVMARKLIHDYLEEVAERYQLDGKGEAVTFCAFFTQAMDQHAQHNPEARRLINVLEEAYFRDRDIYTSSRVKPDADDDTQET